MPAIGQEIAGYELEALLWAGSTSQVWRGRRLRDGARFALKTLPLANRDAREALLTEAALLGLLKHPNIVPIEEVLRLGNDPCLVLAWVDGVDLATWARLRPPMSDVEAVFLQLVRAVAHVHARGIVHRDLQPGNIVVRETHDGPQAVILDFGEATDTAATVIRDASVPVVGAPAYRAPEQDSRPERIDPRSDLFTLGCLLYELLTGAPAFQGEDPLAVTAAIASAPRPTVDDLPADAPELLRGAVPVLLAADPNGRFPSAEALLRYLGVESTQRPILPQTPPPTPYPWGTVVIVAALSVLGALLLAWGAARDLGSETGLPL